MVRCAHLVCLIVLLISTSATPALAEAGTSTPRLTRRTELRWMHLPANTEVSHQPSRFLTCTPEGPVYLDWDARLTYLYTGPFNISESPRKQIGGFHLVRLGAEGNTTMGTSEDIADFEPDPILGVSGIQTLQLGDRLLVLWPRMVRPRSGAFEPDWSAENIWIADMFGLGTLEHQSGYELPDRGIIAMPLIVPLENPDQCGILARMQDGSLQWIEYDVRQNSFPRTLHLIDDAQLSDLRNAEYRDGYLWLPADNTVREFDLRPGTSDPPRCVWHRPDTGALAYLPREFWKNRELLGYTATPRPAWFISRTPPRYSDNHGSTHTTRYEVLSDYGGGVVEPLDPWFAAYYDRLWQPAELRTGGEPLIGTGSLRFFNLSPYATGFAFRERTTDGWRYVVGQLNDYVSRQGYRRIRGMEEFLLPDGPRAPSITIWKFRNSWWVGATNPDPTGDDDGRLWAHMDCPTWALGFSDGQLHVQPPIWTKHRPLHRAIR